MRVGDLTWADAYTMFGKEYLKVNGNKKKYTVAVFYHPGFHSESTRQGSNGRNRVTEGVPGTERIFLCCRAFVFQQEEEGCL